MPSKEDLKMPPTGFPIESGMTDRHYSVIINDFILWEV